MALVTFKNLPDTSTPLNAENLNNNFNELNNKYSELNNKMPSVINNLISTSTTDALSANQGKILNEKIEDKYSLNEITTNKIWLNGKVVYRKGYQITLTSSIGTATIPLNINNIEEITDLYGKVSNDISNTIRPLPFASPNAADSIRIDVTSSNIRIITGSSWEGYSGYIFVEYTKK